MGKRKSNKEFIEELADIMPHITPLEEYKGSKVKILVKSTKCGHSWRVRPNDLFSGYGCPYCAGTRHKTNDEFVSELKEKCPNVIPLDEYRNAVTKIRAKCKACGNTWEVRPNDLFSGYGCPQCAKQRVAKANTKSKEAFLEELNVVNNSIDLVGPFINRSTLVQVKCKQCGHVWDTRPDMLLQGHGCPRCKREEVSRKQSKNKETFLQELNVTNNTVALVGPYKNATTKTEFQCLLCGHKWSVIPISLLRGYGCPECAKDTIRRKLSKSHSTFVNELYEINPEILVEGEYLNAKTKIEVRCKICNHAWTAIPNSLLRGHGCPKCGAAHTSFMEQFIYLSFCKKLGSERVKNRDKSAIGEELDIYIPDLKMAIEPGSWYFHRNRVKQDSEKRKKCVEAGIREIIVYDSFPNNQTSPFEDDIYMFSGQLNEFGNNKLVDLTISLLEIAGCDADDIQWDEIELAAYKEAHYNANDAFLQKLQAIAPSLEALEEYRGSGTPILVNDTSCEHKPWYAIPNNLLKGSGCPYCAGNRKATLSEFMDNLKFENPHIILIGDYINLNTPVEVYSEECGHKWKAYPYRLLQGKKCPKCSKATAANNRRYTHSEFVEKIRLVNPNINVVGEYIDNRTKLLVSSKLCSHEWMALPDSLMGGHGCPICGKKKGRKKKSNEEFIKEIKERNIKYIPLETYNGSGTKIRVKCPICEHVWSITPNNLLHGYGCPRCAGTMRKTNEEFVSELRIKNPNIDPLEEYKSATTKIMVKCKECGFIWDVRPHDLLSGYGCPQCAKNRSRERMKSNNPNHKSKNKD